jgi:transcriptional regulator with XRE-family HTH domain
VSFVLYYRLAILGQKIGNAQKLSINFFRMAGYVWSNNLKNLRKAIGLSQEQLGLALKKGRRIVVNWENGVSEPSLADLVAITIYFGISIDDFIKVVLTGVHLKFFFAYHKYGNDVHKSVLGGVHRKEEFELLGEVELELQLYKDALARGDGWRDPFIERYGNLLFPGSFEAMPLTVISPGLNDDNEMSVKLGQLQDRVSFLEKKVTQISKPRQV